MEEGRTEVRGLDKIGIFHFDESFAEEAQNVKNESNST